MNKEQKKLLKQQAETLRDAARMTQRELAELEEEKKERRKNAIIEISLLILGAVFILMGYFLISQKLLASYDVSTMDSFDKNGITMFGIFLGCVAGGVPISLYEFRERNGIFALVISLMFGWCVHIAITVKYVFKLIVLLLKLIGRIIFGKKDDSIIE